MRFPAFFLVRLVWATSYDEMMGVISVEIGVPISLCWGPQSTTRVYDFDFMSWDRFPIIIK